TVDCNGTLAAPTTTDICAGNITGTTTDTLNFVEGGSTTITWTFDDGNGNTTTASQVYNYDDTTAPVTPTLPDLNAQCSITPIAPTTTDNCEGTITGTTSSTFPITTQGTTIVTWNFDDGNGNSINVNQNVIINDTTPPTAICQNITITIDASGSTSISESDIDNGSFDNCGIAAMTLDTLNFDCSNLGANTVTLTVRDNANNISTCTATVTVEDPAQNASVNISVNTNEICENENVIFTAAPVNGGTVPIYEWFINGVSFGTNSDTFIPFTALNNGDDVYVLMQSSLSSCIIPKQSNTITMIVNPLPIVSGPSNFCIGDTATLTPATSGWVSNSGIASIDNNGVVTANSSGTATFTFTDGNGCSSDFSLVINDLPIITNLPSGSTICVNESHSLSTSVNGTWNSSDNSIATISNTGDILGIAAGNVDFIFTDSNGCSGTTVSIEVQESPIITSISASESPVCAGDPSILSVDVPGSGTNIETLINYDFNSGNNYGALNGQEAPGITSTVYEGNNMPFSRQGGVATGGSAFTTNNTAGNALRQIDGAGDDEGYWVFDIEGSDLNTYEDFSLYFQTRRTNRRGSDKYIYIYYRVNNSGPFNYFSQVFINNNNAATNWTQVTAPVPALANNPSRLQIAVLVTDGRNSNNRRPNILIDNFQVQGTTVGSDYLYSWTSNTGADSGLPADAGTPLSTNDNITVNPEVTTEYDVTVTNSNGCSVTTQVTVDVFPSPEITVNADYCPIDDPSTSQDESNMVQLVASANVPISSWTWLTDPEQTGNTIYVDIADFYQVIGLTPDGCSESGTISVAQELVIDGDFTNVDIMDDSGYTFQSGHTFVPNQPGLVPANRGELWNDSGLLGYTITHRGDDVHRFFRGTDHTQNTVGPQNFMAVNGDSGIQVWSQNNTAIQPNTTYYFSAWVMRLVNGNPPQLVFNINGTQVGISITPPARSGPDNVNNNWVRFYGNWTSGPTENFADISIENLNPNQGGNDYGIDDISFGTLSTFIRLTSPDGTDSNQIICQNEPITNVTYDIGGGLDLPNIEWFLNGSTTSLGLNVFPDGLSATFNGLEYVISGSPEDYGVFDYTITTSSICDVKETNGVIVVNEAPVATIDAITTPICFSQGSIPLSVTLGGTATSGTWSSSGSGNFSNISSNGTSAIYNFGINDTGSVILSFTTNDPSGPCGAQTANVEVDITTYAIADAGNNIDNTLSSCEDVTVSLSANSSVGEWSVTSSQDPSTYFFSNASDSNSSFTGESGETYTLQWEAINTSPCSNTMDTITVTFANCGTNITFDGAEDYISFGNNYDLNINSFSLEAWIKADELSGSRTIFSKRSSDNSNTGYDLTLIGNRLFFRWDRNQVFATQTINNSKWYHVAVTFGRNAYNMYIDGFRVLTTTSGNAPSPNANKALIGAMDTSNDEPVNYFGGDIDEVRIWDVALSEGQIREMMNQEIEANGTNVRGVVVPLDISDNLQWRNLIGYYQMRFGPQAVVSNGTIQDISTSSPISGQLTKMTDVQEEAAPIPYVSNTDGVWDSESTWLNGSVQQIPNSKVNSINGFQQNWNIVRTATNVKTDRPSNTFNRTTVLGLLVDDNRLSIENDQHIIVDKYLIIDGTLDLVGESQLLQPMGSIVDYSGIGKLERSQQGTSNLYNYNYWSSPVSSDGNTYSIGSTLYDGSNLTNIQPLNWISGHDANPSTTPISITRRWLYLYENYPENTYADWRAINENTPINVGLGYTMKGSGSSSADQNYVFVGQPNNGLITTPVSGGFQALIGNPYPSAIDSETFINDNSSVLSDGALYFWEHAPSNSSHVLAAYEGGYAVRNLTNGIPAVSTPEINGTGNANKIPGRYVPVAQGFYVTGNATGGQITFNNNQRIFAKETNSTSLFLRSTNTEPENEVADASESNDQFIRLDFISPQNSIRHLLIGFMDNENATDGIDYGYDALNTESFPSDMSFNIEGQKFLIQGVNTFDVTKSYPLDIDLTTGGPIEIALDDLENFDEEIDVFIFDAEFGTYTRFNDVNFQMNLEAGSYSGRFSLVFQEDATLSTIQNEFENVTLRYLSDTNEIYLKTPASVEVKQLYLINVTGQTIASWNATNLPMSNEIKIPVRSISEGAYIVKAETDTGTFNRKLIVKYK
ncbi:MAG: LamG-like jellyroll fold domain-containing protein, partial [Winogradskyella sp.]|uniref:LamG-like jellyroll fold domain-containing protein n=1 Tax=Winogradskyella sp. TaxID=1883156 RepID=UPI00385D803D